MKRSIFFVISILSFIILSQIVSSEINDDLITGNMVVDPITGKLTTQQVGMSIFVQTTIPYVQITSPKNQTYLKNESILLDYTLVNGDYVWYNIDNSENTTINSSIYINVSQGEHTLYVFSNNSNISAVNSIVFTTNSSKFIILFENYKGTNKGTSTNFIDYTYEEIQNLDNVTLENTNYGKIKFNEAINMTNDKNFTDNLLDIDSNIIFSSNSIELKSEEIPNFNKSSTIWLYNLNFTNPRILKDEVICPSTICTKESYTSNTLKFNVTSFSVYSAEETPSGEPSNPPSGGDKETIPEEVEKKFEIEPKEIKISLKQGDIITRKILIKNMEDKALKFELTSSSLEDFIKINETEFYVNAKKSKEIEVSFMVSEDTLPDLYIGKIVATAEGTQKEILTVIEVESQVSLFDVKMRIPDRYKYVFPGEEVLAQIELYNIGSNENVDVFIDYIIKDDQGNEIVKEHDTMAIKNSANFAKNIKLPEDLALGKYAFYVKITYDGKIASASSWFNIGKRSDEFYRKIYLLLIFLIVLVIILLIYIWKRNRKIKKYYKYYKKDTL